MINPQLHNLEPLQPDPVAQSGAPLPPRSTTEAQKNRNRSTPKKTLKKHRGPISLVFLYGVRLLIVGVGLGVIAGSLLTALDPGQYNSIAATEYEGEMDRSVPLQSSKTQAQTQVKPVLQVTTEMAPLKQDVEALIRQYPDLETGVFILDLDTGAYLDIAGKQILPTASIIKLPILIAFFQEVDRGNIRLDEELVMRADLVASEAGRMQYLPIGTTFTALETATEMIRISDNTATNMLIDRLGGTEALNQRFKDWGLSQTVIHNLLPDLEGTNVSTPYDFVKLLALLNQGELLSLRSRDRCLSILQTPITNTLLPAGLGEGATIAHKTGDIGSLVGDAGMIDMVNGKRYLAAVMVKRPHNDYRAQELIRQISRTTYQFLASVAHQSEHNSPNMLPTSHIANDAEHDRPAVMSTQ